MEDLRYQGAVDNISLDTLANGCAAVEHHFSSPKINGGGL